MRTWNPKTERLEYETPPDLQDRLDAHQRVVDMNRDSVLPMLAMCVGAAVAYQVTDSFAWALGAGFLALVITSFGYAMRRN